MRSWIWDHPMHVILPAAAAALCMSLAATCQRVHEDTFDLSFDDTAHRWDRTRFPLVVTVMGEVNVDAVEAAANLWNQGECKLLSFEGRGDDGDIVVVDGDDTHGTPRGNWLMRFDPHLGLWTGEAIVRASSNIGTDMVIAAQEIGHLLGLAHDLTMRTSIMHPEAASREPWEVRPTDADLRALAERYCR